MTRHGAVRAAWWVLVVVFVTGVAASVVFKHQHSRDDLIAIPFTAWGVVGAFVAWRRPANPLGWMFLSIGALSGLAGLAASVTSQPAAMVPPVAWYVVLAAWYQQWFFFPTFAMSSVLTVLLFPNGLPSRRWRPVLWTTVAAVTVLSVLSAVAPRLTSATMAPGAKPVANPLAVPGVPVLGQGQSSSLFAAAFVALFASGVAAVVSAVLRYRRSTGVERLQLRWFVFAVAVSGVTFAVIGFGGVVQGSDNGVAVQALAVITNLVLAFVPISCGIAILRYHLFDIDRVVSRTTSYAIVTAVVVGVYVAVVTFVPHVLPNSSSLAVAAATLLAAALVRPVLRRVQAAVDRRFNRAKVDAQRTVDAFGARLREEVDTDVVRADLVGAVARTLEPATIGLWLRA